MNEETRPLHQDYECQNALAQILIIVSNLNGYEAIQVLDIAKQLQYTPILGVQAFSETTRQTPQ